MSFENLNYFTKDNLNNYLKALAKEFRKWNGTTITTEVILIGGASILANYAFRYMTTDIDAVIHASSAMKDAINQVGDKYHLPNGWLNTDFMRTSSYSPKLIEVSKYYKTFSNILQVRTIDAEYLIAMKLRSGRKYKNDLSDIVGILAEHENRGQPITYEKIDHAMNFLYDGWDSVSVDTRQFIENILCSSNYEKIYADVHEQEKNAKDVLIRFEKDYPGVVGDSNANDIIKTLKAKQKPSITEKLNEYQKEVDSMQRGKSLSKDQTKENKNIEKAANKAAF